MQSVTTNGARLRELRQTHGLTQTQLARDCGIPSTVICHVEAGRRDLNLERQFRVAARLGVPVEEITTITGEATEVPA